MVRERYVKLDEIRSNGDVFGVIMDVTADTRKRKELETENADISKNTEK